MFKGYSKKILEAMKCIEIMCFQSFLGRCFDASDLMNWDNAVIVEQLIRDGHIGEED